MRISKGFLLDTCAMIWLSHGESIEETAIAAIRDSHASGEMLSVSVMSVWELGMLVSKGRLHSTKPADLWFEEFVEAGEISVQDVTPRVLVAASFLPGPVHNDPVDRILIATARERDLTILTRDRAILGYGMAGHVKTFRC
jgi:PIN domain nuclease of toxin-antitoxin system